MGNEWKIVELGDHCKKIGSGATPRGGSSVYMETGEISLIRSQNIHNWGFDFSGLVYIDEVAADKLKNVIVHKNDVLLNITGDSVARVCLPDSEALPARVNQHVAIIRPNPESFDHRFIRYFLSSPQQQKWLISLASSGGTRNALTKGMISSLEIPKPEISEQRRIAHILGTLDDKIALNRQQNATLEAMAQALFRSWFVDFDPVLDKALAAGHDIPEPLQPKAQRRLALGDKRKPLPPEVTGLFPDRFVYEEEVGWVPEGWVVKPAKEIYDISIGKTPPRKEPEWFSLDESNISWVSIRDMGNAEIFISSTSEYLTEEAVEKFRVVRVPKGSVILSFKLTIGRVAIAGSDLCTNEAIAHFKANSRSPGQFWTYLYLKDFNFDSLGSTSSIATAINSKIVKSMPIVVCGIDILDAFNEEVKPIFEKIAVNVDQVRNLVKLRDTLLPKLISGELQVNG